MNARRKLPHTLAAFICAFSLVCAASIAAAEWRYENILRGLAARPTVEVVRYPVTGHSAEELRRELDTKGPSDLQGRRGDAFTHWKVNWRWRRDANGKPIFDPPLIETRIRVTLPQWQAPAGTHESLRTEWDDFMQALIHHEMQHVQHAEDIQTRILERLKLESGERQPISATAANKIVRSVVDEARAQDLLLDKTTQHGKSQGVRFPKLSAGRLPQVEH